MANRLTDAGKKKINNQLERKAIQIVRESKQRAPVDTGRLRSSITYESERQPNGLKRFRIGSDVSYAPFVEFGTIYQAPQPFLRPAFRSVIKGI